MDHVGLQPRRDEKACFKLRNGGMNLKGGVVTKLENDGRLLCDFFFEAYTVFRSGILSVIWNHRVSALFVQANSFRLFLACLQYAPRVRQFTCPPLQCGENFRGYPLFLLSEETYKVFSHCFANAASALSAWTTLMRNER